MQTVTIEQAVLLGLHRLALRDRPASTDALATLLRISPRRVARALARLDRSGLAHADRVRLSLAGLCVAASLDANVRRALRNARPVAFELALAA